MDQQARYHELAREIREHDRRYYQANDPIIADVEYDRLRRELEDIEAAHPDWVVEWSPSKKVGYAPGSDFAKVERRTPMLSLDNTYNEDELRAWHERVVKGLHGLQPVCVVEPKIDGIGIELTYRDGHFTLGTTRGDGLIGDDITENVRLLPSLLQRLAEPINLVVRGEIYMDRADFVAINQERQAIGEEIFKNPRNLAGGLLHLKPGSMLRADAKPEERRRQDETRRQLLGKLKLLVYEVPDNANQSLQAQQEILQWLRDLGLPVADNIVSIDNVEQLLQTVAAWRAEREKLAFDVDGLVVKVNALAQRQELGAKDRSPRWAIAYKYPAQQATTRVLGLTVYVGRTGAITPVAILDPVELSGSTVSNASLHNWDEVARKDVRIGDYVLVEKAGEIIPQIVTVIVERRPAHAASIEPPVVCPSCGAALERHAGEVTLYCSRDWRGCQGQLVEWLAFFAARDNMNIDGLGYERLVALVEAGLVKDPADLYALTTAQLAPVYSEKHDPTTGKTRKVRIGEKNAAKIIEGLERSKQSSLARLLGALGIPLIGGVAARAVAEHFSSLERLLSLEENAIYESLIAVAGFGAERARAVAQFFAQPENREVLTKLKAHGIDPMEQRLEIVGPLSGKTFCITGTLSQPRGEIARLIEEAGGKTTDSVTRVTNFLVAGEEVGANKLEKARKLGVVIIDEAKLRSLIQPPQI